MPGQNGRHAEKVLLLFLCAAVALASSGCVEKKVRAQPSFNADLPPIIPPRPNTPLDSNDDSPPELEMAAPEPVTIPIAKSAPSRPRTSATPPPTDAELEPEPPRPAPPQIQPRLSAEQQAAAEHQTNESIQAAERNLQAALGKQLNPTQSDLVGKIKTFLGQAREAIRDGDWLRALNLAKKAQVLSAELLSSS